MRIAYNLETYARGTVRPMYFQTTKEKYGRSWELQWGRRYLIVDAIRREPKKPRQ